MDQRCEKKFFIEKFFFLEFFKTNFSNSLEINGIPNKIVNKMCMEIKYFLLEIGLESTNCKPTRKSSQDFYRIFMFIHIYDVSILGVFKQL